MSVKHPIEPDEVRASVPDAKLRLTQLFLAAKLREGHDWPSTRGKSGGYHGERYYRLYGESDERNSIHDIDTF